MSVADFDVLEQTLTERRLLPLIGSRAIAVEGASVPDTFRRAVLDARAAARAHGLAVEWSTRRTVALLAGRGISALPLKGPVLGQEAYDDLGLRPTADIDLLLHRDQLDAAVGLLLEQGFAPPTDPRRPDGLPELHWVMAHPGFPPVELHWRVHWYETQFSEDMLARASPGCDDILRPETADLVASLLLFYARDGFYGVRFAADLAAWWDRHGRALPPGFLEPYPRRYPELGPALTAAARVAEAVAGVPAVSWLGNASVPTRRVALATRLADWTQHGDPDQLRANVSLVGGLLGPPGSGPEFVRRELLEKATGRRATVVHCVKTGGRYVLALWRARRPGPATCGT